MVEHHQAELEEELRSLHRSQAQAEAEAELPGLCKCFFFDMKYISGHNLTLEFRLCFRLALTLSLP